MSNSLQIPVHSNSHRQPGQALIESLIAIAVFALVTALAIALAKIQSIEMAAIRASRDLAFGCGLMPERCVGPNALAEEIAPVHFDRKADPINPVDTWTTRTANRLLQRYDDVAVTTSELRFDAGVGLVSRGRRSAAGSAADLMSRLAGPSRFGLSMTTGLFRAQVDLNLLARSRATRISLPDAPMVRLRARQAILTDAWLASGPYGRAVHTVESRVNAGRRLNESIETALDVGYAPTRSLIYLMGRIGLEPLAGELRHGQIDVDHVPADRLEQGPGVIR